MRPDTGDISVNRNTPFGTDAIFIIIQRMQRGKGLFEMDIALWQLLGYNNFQTMEGLRDCH